DSVSATWSGITSPTSTDWVGLFPAGAANSAYLFTSYTSGTASGSVPISVPNTAAAGSYEVRLFAHNGFTLLATATLSVIAPSATLSLVPITAAPGDSVSASWSGITSPTKIGRAACVEG